MIPPARSGRREPELVVAGLRAVRASLERRPEDALRLFLLEWRVAEFAEVLRGFAEARLPYRVVPAEELARIAGTERHEGVVLVTRPIPEHDLDVLPRSGRSVVLAAPGIENPHNLGALLRVGAHFGLDALLLEEGDPRLSAAACRVAEGGAEHVAVIRVPHAAAALAAMAQRGYTVLTTTSHEPSMPLHSVRLPERVAWVVGSESRGLPAALLRAPYRAVTIAGTGAVESLNLATAAAVLLGETARQRALR